MNYQIIKDENLLKKFINWLPELKNNEKYYLTLFARQKYTNKIKIGDKAQLKRFTSTKERMFDKIKQLECELGSYKINGQSVPNEGLVLYITPNPRDMKIATYSLIRNCATLLEKDGNFNIHAEALSVIQKSCGTRYFMDFDIDDKEINLSLMEDILHVDYYDIIETRGGYHILVKTKEAPKTQWVLQIKNTYKIDQIGDQLLPVVGCTQGDFTPKFINL